MNPPKPIVHRKAAAKVKPLAGAAGEIDAAFLIQVAAERLAKSAKYTYTSADAKMKRQSKRLHRIAARLQPGVK